MKQLQKLTLIAASLLLSHAVSAEQPDQSASPGIDTPDAAFTAEEGVAEADAALLDLDAFQEAGVLSDDELGSHRAREDISIDQITINDQDQDGDVTDNVAMGNTNGDNLIDGEAFSNSSGFLSTVQNTGNNVLIQSSTIINVSVETPSAE